MAIFLRGRIRDYALARADNPTRMRYTGTITVIFGAVLGVLVSLCSVGAGALGVAVLFSLYPRLPPVRIVGSDLAHAVPLSLWPAWATGSSAAWIKEASRAVCEYLIALDAARSDEESSGGDDSGASGGGSRRSAPKEVSLTDPQAAAWVARKSTDPFFAYDANYLIDNKAGIIVDAGSGAGRGACLGRTKRT